MLILGDCSRLQSTLKIVCSSVLRYTCMELISVTQIRSDPVAISNLFLNHYVAYLEIPLLFLRVLALLVADICEKAKLPALLLL